MRFQALFWTVGLALFAGGARAEGPSFDASELPASGAVRRYELALGPGPIRAGGAAVVVTADVAAVHRLVTDYARYESWLPGFHRSRVVARTADGTDVYLEVPILHGAAKVWAVTRFAPPEAEGGGERIDGKMIGPGNIDDLRAVWHLTPVDDQHTLLRLELLMVPRLHFASGLITSALAESADDAVAACRKRLESAVSVTP